MDFSRKATILVVVAVEEKVTVPRSVKAIKASPALLWLPRATAAEVLLEGAIKGCCWRGGFTGKDRLRPSRSVL